MAGFKDQLNKEIERRQLNKQDDVSIASADSIEVTPVIKESEQKFSFRTFLLGLTMIFFVLSALIFWAFIKSDTTKQTLAQRLSSKTVLVDKIKPEIVMPAVVVKPVVANKPNENMKSQESTKTEPVIPVQIPQNTPSLDETTLVSAPIPGLYESTDRGLIPIIRQKDGLTPFDAYKKPFNEIAGKPIVSFVVNNIGLSKEKTFALIENLPDGISLAFSPYAQDLKQMVDMARADGHETWINLPLETTNYPRKDPGPLSILKNVSEQQNQERLYRLLASASGYTGLITNKNHAYNNEAAITSPSLNEVYTRGMMIFDSKQSSEDFTKALSVKYDAPFGKTDIWLDDTLTPIALNRQIRKIIELGKAKRQVTVSKILNWPPFRLRFSMPNKSSALYRPCVGICLFNNAGQVFVGERLDNLGAWQMPQGGIDPDEDILTAAMRELKEEIGTNNATLLKISEEKTYYDIPANILERLHEVWDVPYTGQEQTWVAMRFDGEDANIDLEADDHPEFAQWQWVDLDKTLDIIVPFKRDTYLKVINAFKKFS